jgi:hypothetical protein
MLHHLNQIREDWVCKSKIATGKCHPKLKTNAIGKRLMGFFAGIIQHDNTHPGKIATTTKTAKNCKKGSIHHLFYNYLQMEHGHPCPFFTGISAGIP